MTASMYNVLVIDDEPEVLEGIVTMIRSADHLALEIYQANSPHDALDILQRQKIDMTVTDIRMPGMSGLEIAHAIRAEWPQCRVIFLSGYNDFDYIQRAMKLEAVDYILKLDCEEELIAALGKAVRDLQNHHHQEAFLRKVEYRYREVLPLLLHQFLKSLTQGVYAERGEIEAKIDKLNVPLLASEPLLIMMGKVDEWSRYEKEVDRTLVLYAIQNIAEDYLREHFRLISSSMNDYEILWLMQARNGSTTGGKSGLIIESKAESIQETVQQFYHLPVSFVVQKESVEWRHLPEAFRRMRRTLSQGYGLSRALIYPDRAPFEGYSGKASSPAPRDLSHLLDQLRLYFSGNFRQSPLLLLKGRMLMNVFPTGFIYQGEPTFVLSVEMSMPKMMAMLDQLKNGKSDAAALVNIEEGWVFAEPAHTAQFQEIVRKLNDDSFRQDALDMTTITIDGTRYLLSYQPFSAFQVGLVTLNEESRVLGNLSNYRKWVWAISAISFFLVIAVSYYVYKLIHYPLRKMVSAFKKVEQGILNINLSGKMKDEFAYLYK